jgi:hypothetical protein
LFYIMTKTAIPLRDLAQRISQQQADLEKLRQEYESRKDQMRELTRRKLELQAQLRQVEAELRGLDEGSTPAVAGTSAPKRAPTKAGKNPTMGLTLSQFLMQIVTTAGRPVTTKELATEVVRQNFPTTSRNVAALVDTQVYQLVKKGVLQRAKDRPGVLPAQPRKHPTAPAAKPKAATAKPTAISKNSLSLTAMVTKVLAKSPHPLKGRELAEKVLASGYETTSKSFTDIIWDSVGKMENVENVPGKGYRLKKSRGKGSK